jgi:hypothetical protein
MKQKICYLFCVFLFLGWGSSLLSDASDGQRTALMEGQLEEYSNIIEKLQKDIFLKEHTVEYLEDEISHLQKDLKLRTNIGFRLTSYHPKDKTGSGHCTGSGLCTDDFVLNEKGWYTYKNMLVLGASTEQCLSAKSGACGKWNIRIKGKKYFKYHERIMLVIDGVEYAGTILDSCGACMSGTSRIDLFVKDKGSIIDRGYLGQNPIRVSW